MVNDILGERYFIQQPLAKKAGRRTLLARLHIDREQIAQSCQILCLKYHYPRPAPRQQTFKLQRTRSIYKKDAEGNQVDVKPQINIWAGTQRFEIGGGGLLSEPELDWLAHELSD